MVDLFFKLSCRFCGNLMMYENVMQRFLLHNRDPNRQVRRVPRDQAGFGMCLCTLRVAYYPLVQHIFISADNSSVSTLCRCVTLDSFTTWCWGIRTPFACWMLFAHFNELVLAEGEKTVRLLVLFVSWCVKGYDVLVTEQDFPVCMCSQSAANQSPVSPLWLELSADGTQVTLLSSCPAEWGSPNLLSVSRYGSFLLAVL